MPHDEILRFEEIIRIVRVFSERGITKVRITGGEPLVRRGIIHLIEELAKVPLIRDLSLTTNGVLLGKYSNRLKDAGLRRINISLDSLQPEKFQWITRRDKFGEVWQGIERAMEVGLNPVKIKMEQRIAGSRGNHRRRIQRHPRHGIGAFF